MGGVNACMNKQATDASQPKKAPSKSLECSVLGTPKPLETRFPLTVLKLSKPKLLERRQSLKELEQKQRKYCTIEI